MTEVSEDQMAAIIGDGISFMRTITQVYGSEKGMELWETIADTIDPSIKGKIFFTLLTGIHESRVILSGAVFSANKITCIKLIRQYTGLGLTEAKNAYEQAADYGQQVHLTVDAKHRRIAVDELRYNGMIVS